MKSKMFALIPLVLLSVLPTFRAVAQDDQTAFFIKKIYDTSLTDGQCYEWLRQLTKSIGSRLSGSPQAAAAVEYTRQVLDTLGLDRVWLQPVWVPRWTRGEPEVVRVSESKMGSFNLHALALGGSIGTDPNGIQAEVIEVKSLEALDSLGEKKIKGKIVFFNKPFDQRHINTFRAYGGSVGTRVNGPSEAARLGAVGVLVRSMASGLDDIPHTGSLRYREDLPKIPAVAISTNDAELLSKLLALSKVSVYMRTDCKQLPDVLSYNVIGEIKGHEKPDEVILVGGHLDSWDVGEGAHDDGAGCVQSMEVLRLLKKLGYRPRHTIRCVLFMNEENGLQGGRVYADSALLEGVKHLAAIESDRGGFTPRGFTVDYNSENFAERFSAMQKWLPWLEPYYLHINRGGGGADITPLRSHGTLLIGYEPDPQRYFDYHHTAADVFEAVNKRELELGAATMTTLVFLIDHFGLD